MSFVDDVLADVRRRRKAKRPRAWPVGPGSLTGLDDVHGHDQSTFSPEEYGDYIATSNEVFSAAVKRARLMSSLPLCVYRGRDADKLAVTAGPAHDLLYYVNPFWTCRRLARMDELSMCLWGQSFWAIERRDGVPAEIWWMKPSRVRPVPHEKKYLQHYLYEPANGGPLIEFGPDEVVWFRYPNPVDEFSPLSPLAAARLGADTASAMMKSNRSLFSQGLQLGGIIVPDSDKVAFTQDQAEDLERQLQRRFTGADKAHRWAVLRYEAQFKQMNISPKDAEFVDGMRLTGRQVWNAYGIPAPLMNDPEGATLANVRELMREFWENTLVPDSQLRAEEIEEQFLPLFRRVPGGPDHCEYDYTRVPSLQESASESWGRERQAIEVGALTINEWRAGKGMPGVAWGDVYWAPVNKSAVASADDHPEGDTAPTPADPPASEDPSSPEYSPPRALTNGDERAARELLATLDLPVGSL